jgi:hypothetical protein
MDVYSPKWTKMVGEFSSYTPQNGQKWTKVSEKSVKWYYNAIVPPLKKVSEKSVKRVL